MGLRDKRAKSEPGFPDRSQDVQSVPAGGVISHSDPMKPSSKSIGGRLGETFAKMSQVYRQRVTHLMSDGGEMPRMRESSGGSVKLSPSSNCCSGCATMLDLNYSENEVCSLSILSSSDSSLPSFTTSRGSRSTPRSPTRLHTPSTTSLGAGRSRTTGQCTLKVIDICHVNCYRCFSGFEAD